ETAAHNDTASDLVHHASIAEQTRIADITVPAAAPDLTAPIKGISVIEPSTLNAAGADAAQLSDWQISATDSSVTVTATLRDSTIGTLSDGQSSGTSLTMTGTADEAQAWLNSLTFKAADVELGNNAATSQLDVHVSSESGDASGSMDITVTPSNDPVTVADNHQTVAEIGSTAITDTTLFAVDPEVSAGTQFPVQIVYGLTELPKYGYLTLDGDRLGIGSVFTQEDVINGSLVYVHTATGADQNTADGFVAVVNDGATPKDLSGTVHITLDIAPLNQLPSVGGSGLVYEGQPANAVDTGNVGQYIVASTGGDPQDTILTIAITSLPTHGTLYYNGVEVTVGQTFDYADRSLLTYKNDGSENQGQDSFGVRVTDQGGGTGVPGNSDGVITLRVQDVDDDPTFTGNGRTPNADVPSTGTTAVTLTADMLSASDVDSGNNHLSFITDNSGLTHGYLTLNGKILNNGGTFTKADILAGKVQYVQYAGASTAGQTDSFNFVLVDNTMALRWNDDGSRYNRAGGIYDPGTQTLTRFTFTLGLVQFANGSGIGTLPTSDPQIAHSDSSWAGAVFTTGDSRGQLNEGGSVTLNGTNGDFSAVAGMSYTATDVDPSQVVYTFLGFSNGATGGEIQRKDSSGNWVTVGAYGTFTQADLDAGNIRFQHDGGETFFFAAQFAVSAGLTKTDQNGYITQDIWTPTLNIYVTPVNDLPVVTGSSTTVIAEGETAYITTGQLSISDPDDANSGSDLESSATLRDGVDNYAYNNGAGGGTPLKFEIDSLPTGGTLQYYDGSAWKDVTVGMTLDAALLTASTNTTGLRFVNDGSEVRKTDFTVTAIDRWGARSASSGKVTIQITNVNDAPQIAKNPTLADPVIQPNSPNIIGGAPENNPLYVKEGSYQQITSALLQAYDSDSSTRQVQYTITSAPAHGNLAYSTDGVHFSIIGAGGSFTQQDVIDGHIYYLSDGSEGSGRSETSTPNTPDDKFTFRLSDGDKEQSGNEFWIYTLPTNDAPIVSAPSGVHNITSENPANNHITGFSVSDPDLTAIITGETDYLQVTVRLLDRSGNALTDYTGVTLGYDSSSGAATAITHSGQNDYLVLSGTYAQVNAALAGLTVTFTGDRNTLYQVQVIADDRLRDASGALVGGANGGSENQSNTPGKSQPGTISSTEYNWYSSTTVAEADKGNISMASVWVRASTINDPGTLTITTPARTALEDQATFIGGNITLSDVESTSFGTPVTVTITVAEGTLGIGGSGTQESVTPSATGSQQVTISGDDTGTLVLTGRASDIQALLNDTTLGLTWTSPLNTNHDLNGAAPGDVTVTLHLDDGGSHIGDTAGGANPADATLDVTIVPVNDAPTVSADSSTAYLNSDRGVTNGNAVSGFVISDPDYTDGGDIADGESDFMQVTVRITDTDGTPLAAAFYNNGSVSSIIINSGNTQSGVTLDTTFDGNKDALVIRGTLAQVNAYLADLQVSMTGSGVENADKAWHVEVIADDRMRDLTTGALLSAGNANGGKNDANGNGTQTVPTTVIDPYAALPAGLTQNVAIAARTIFPSSINDPATITVTDSNVSEGVARVKLPAIAVADPDADVATLQATITLPSGFTFSGLNSGDVVTTDASGHQTLALSGTLSELNARLANLTVQLPTTTGVAATDWNGSFSVTVVVNDNGNHGSRPSTLDGDSNDPGSNPGDISYADATSAALITTRTFTVTVVPVNDAPGLTKTTPQTLAPISEDSADATTVGDTVDNLFGSYFQDTADNVDNSAIGASGGTSSDSFWGVAINSLTTNSAQGSWQYSTDGGSTWTAIGTRTDASSLLLDKTARVRFVPAANFFGTPAALTVRLVETNSNNDTTSTTATPTSGLVTSTATNGGTSRYSARTVTLSTSITGVNDRPVLTGSMPVTMVEDTPQAVTLGSLLSGKYNDDTDNQSAISGGGNASGAAGFVAITGNNTSTSLGHWEYSTDGSTWQSLGTDYSDSNALVLKTTSQLRFVPLADYNGTVPGGLTLHAADTSTTADAGVTTLYAVQDLQSAINQGDTSHWSNAQTVTLTITAVADAKNDAASTHSGTPVTVDVMANDTFSNSNKTLTSVTQGARGSVSIVGGKVLYTPNNSSYVGSDTFTYTVTSGGVNESATVTITMTNSAPVVASEHVSVAEDNSLSGSGTTGLLYNDSDPDGDTLTVTTFKIGSQTYNAGDTATIAGKGTLVVNANGSYTFTPLPDWNGTVPQVTYTVSDGRTNGAVTTTLDITVTPVADTQADTATTHAGVAVTIDVLANDTFSNPDRYLSATTSGLHGTTTIVSGKVIYTPTTGYVGTDTFTYTVSSSGVTETGTVTVTMTNNAPVTQGEQVTTAEDTVLSRPATSGLLINDSDPDGDPLSVVSFSADGHTWSAGVTGTITGKGTLVINSDGSYTFTPVADWNGSVPQVTYTVSDGRSNGLTTATLDITVTPVVDIHDDSATTHAGVPVTIDVLSNDTFSNSNKTLTATTDGQHGTVTIQSGKVIYTQTDASYVGSDTFTYTVTSGGIAETATVSVTLVNAAPELASAHVSTPEDTPLAGQNLLANARDPDGDPLTLTGFQVAGQDYHPGDTAILVGQGSLVMNSDGSYLFTPIADWHGDVSPITWTVSDGRNNGESTATLTITVTPVADANPDSATTHAGVPVVIDVLGNDTFSNPDRTLSATTNGQYGTVTINNGQVVYTPTGGYVGNDTFSYTVTSGGVSETTSVTVTLTNASPVTQSEQVTTPEDTPISGPNLLNNDHDAEGDPLTITGFSVGGLHYQAGDTATLAGSGTLTINSDGSYHFVPVADWHGDVPQVIYSLSDGRSNGTVTATLDIRVTPVMDSHDDSASTHANTPVTIDVLANDTFSNPDRVISGATNGQHGTVVIEDGKARYTPNNGYVGTDTFTYTVTSGGVSETAVVTLDILNTPPVAMTDKASTLLNTPLSGNVLANDSDAEHDVLHVTSVTVDGVHYVPGDTIDLQGAGTLVVNSDGSYRFTPATGWSGFVPTVSYTISDGNVDGTSSSELHLLVSPIGEAWVKEAGLVDSASGTQTTSGTLSLLSLDAMESLTIGGHTLTLAQLTALSATQPFDIVTPDGVLSLTGLRTLDAGHAQLDYRYTLSHAIAQPGFVSTQEDISLSVNGEQTQAPGLLRVNIVNDVPVAQDDSNSIDQDRGEQIVSGNLYANDRIGADGTIASGPLTAVSSVNLGHEGVINGTFKGEFGELTLDANGNYRYVADRMNLRVATLDPLSTLTEVFVYTLTDADGNTSQARLSIVIHGTTPPLSKQGDEIFPHDRRQEETALDQPYTPGLFILPAIYGIYSDRFTREVELNRKVTELGRGANDNATPVLEDAVLFTRWVNTTLLRSPTPSGDNHDVATQQLASRFNPFTPKATGKPTPADVPAIQEERVVHGEATKGKPVVKHDTHENLPPQANISIPGVVVIPAGAPRPGAPGLAEQIDKLARNHTQAPEPITVGGPASTR
ncbi:TPA: tandem-95 repeat protein, partial [Klebsiella variicola]|nr:tandem-95 repeat protein [Klebsiella variicola]